jgi:hypothetical protein
VYCTQNLPVKLLYSTAIQEKYLLISEYEYCTNTIVVPLCDIRYLQHQVRMSHEENYPKVQYVHYEYVVPHSRTRSRTQDDGEVREDTFSTTTTCTYRYVVQ